MPEKRILVVGKLPTTLQIGQKVLTTSGYDEAIEKLTESAFDVIIIPAVCGTTNGHGFLQKIRDFNKNREAKRQSPLPILVHHSSPRLNIVVDESLRVWNLRPSMCSFGNATFVDTSLPGWEEIISSWLETPRSMSQSAA